MAINHYSAVINPLATKDEFFSVRRFVWVKKGKMEKVEFEDDSGKKTSKYFQVSVQNIIAEFLTNSSCATINPNFSKLTEIYVTLTINTADCERGFSLLKSLVSRKTRATDVYLFKWT
eukprot:Pompholyxophrys_sp_v1_NODE_65_length_2590_cov_2.154241.p1 type:complete len:118 gc:universal NODE_65_length_2590_cov_2.154241:1258-905(-)